MRFNFQQIFIASMLFCFATSGAAEGNGAWRTFELAGKTAFVLAATGAESHGYELLVEENTLAVARLEANRRGVLDDAWLTDLDKDGNPEIVVSVGQLNGTNKAGVDVHEWQGDRFSSSRTPQDLPIDLAEYLGHDQYRVENGALIREIPQFQQSSDAVVPTGEKLKFHYDIQANQWLAN